jgi:ParB family chromosome partitioning protein
VGIKLAGKQSLEVIGDTTGESRNQVHRHIRLTELITPILDMVDENRIAFRPAVELSYLPKGKQKILHGIMEANACTPSLAQAVKMRQFEQSGKLTEEVIGSIMAEEKPNQVEMFKMPKQAIERFFPPGTKKREAEEIIVKALEQYYSREKPAPERVRERTMER